VTDTAATRRATRLAPSPTEAPPVSRLPVVIKGDQTGLRVIVRKGTEEDILAAMRAQLAPQLEFFRGAAVHIEFEEPPIDAALAGVIAAELALAGVVLEGIGIRREGAREKRRPPAAGREPDAPPPVPPRAALFLSGTVRGGQRIVHAGPVVVFGDVNPGAEIVAGGSVIVWGQLRGTVEAGLDEGAKAVVCALNLAPTQLRIGGVVARAPEDGARQPEPEVARMEEDRIVVTSWR
jgi:septum site-determining protein MinC